MKTNSLPHLVTIVLTLCTIATTGCGERPAAPLAPVNAPSSPAAAPATPGVQWADLKDLSYDQRIPFFNGFRRLESMVDDQIAALTAKRAAMSSTANTKDWDFAMKEMVNARAYLKSTGDVLGNATPETWNQEKDRVGQAWVRTQEAFAKVNASTTA